MMPLHSRINKATLATEPNLYCDFLDDLRQEVIRMDELHPSQDNDGHYIFLIWVDPEKCIDIRKRVEKNIKRAHKEHTDCWTTTLLPFTGDGLLIVDTYI